MLIDYKTKFNDPGSINLEEQCWMNEMWGKDTQERKKDETDP